MPDPSLSHTLAGVLTKIQRADPAEDPEVARWMNDVFARYEGDLRGVCRRELGQLGRRPELVEEVLQETLLEAWNKRASYEPSGRYLAWLRGIATYKAWNERRKRAAALSEDGFLEEGSGEATALAGLETDQRLALFDEAARNVLDHEERRLVLLRWVEEQSLDDVAAELGLESADRARKDLFRCKRRMEKEVRRLMTERGLSAGFFRS